MSQGLKTHPDRLAIALVVVSWTWMLGHAAVSRRMSCCAQQPSASEEAMAWTCMVIAMMVPTTLESMRDVADRSYRVRRVRAVLAYLFGYLAWWSVLGIAVLAARQFELAHDTRVAAALCVFAAGWALLPARERWRRFCHRRIALYPVGWRADHDALRQGATNGLPCVAICWPLMVACTITGHNLVVMAGCTALTMLEKRMFRLRRRPLVIGALMLAAWIFSL